MRRRRVLRTLLAALAGAVLLSGCEFDVYKLPLPGGTDVGQLPTGLVADRPQRLDAGVLATA